MRNKTIDTFRGLIMILMAIDHVSYFVINIHFYEGYDYLQTHTTFISFITRFITHLCAPGFFFAMGYGAYKKYLKTGFDLSLAKRGLFLVFLQFAVFNIIWDVEVIYYGVIFSLGMSMVVLNFLMPIIKKYGLSVSVFLLVISQYAITLANNTYLFKLLFKPGLIDNHYILYVIAPWLGLAILGSYLSSKKDIPYLKLSLFFLATFVVIRTLNGFGNTHMYNDIQSFFNVTKYPPSTAFITITMGINFLIMGFIERYGLHFKTLITFGKNPLVFYFSHLLLYRFISEIITFDSYMMLYILWGLSLIPLYYICKYLRIKRYVKL